MAVKCATCSEDFLGAVNRCWKCGSYVSLNLEAFQTPPVRRSPVTLRPKAQPQKMAIATGAENGKVITAEMADAPSSQATAQQPPGIGRRRGNPFANDATHAVFVPAASEAMANELAAEKGLWIGMVVGALTWILAFVFPPAALVTALVAVGLAIWGLSSRKKALAGALIVLCIVGFLVSGYTSARWAYDLIAPEFMTSDGDDDSL